MDEEFAVLGVHDGLYGGSEHFYSVAFEHPALEECHSAVECGLSAECEQYAVGAFFFDDFLNEVGCDGEEVDLVGESFGGLYGGDVGVDEDSGDALFLHCFESLRSRVVKFAGFSDLECSGAQQKGFFYFLVLVVCHDDG